MKRWRLWLSLVVVVLAAGFLLYTGYQWWIQFPIRQVSGAQVVQPERLTMVREVPAYGQIMAPTPVVADFDTGGTIAALHIAEGDSVVAGQLLAKLDATALELAVASAQAGVTAAQAQLDLVRRAPSAEDVVALEAGVEVARAGVKTAEALVAGARANLSAASAGSPPEELAIAEKRIEDARAALWGAQAQRDAICGRVGKGLSQADCDNAEAAVSRAEQAVAIAGLQLEQLEAGVRSESIAPYRAQLEQSLSGLETAKAQLAQAEASVARALQPVSDEAVAVAQAAVAQAQAGLARAQQQLGLIVLSSPIAGTVTRLDAAVGQTVAAGQPAALITDLTLLEIAVLVNERYIGEVQVGQPARVRFEAYPQAWASAQVTEIATARSSTAGGANYRVTLELAANEMALREGMAIEAAIETGRHEQALAVPREVLRLDAEGWHVLRFDGTSTAVTRIQTGFRQGRYVEVVSGLDDDSSIVVAETTLGTERGDYGWLPFGLFWRVN